MPCFVKVGQRPINTSLPGMKEKIKLFTSLTRGSSAI
jgi:hypothetical protein